jgi:F-type H+-transporting ATPase subunit b
MIAKLEAISFGAAAAVLGYAGAAFGQPVEHGSAGADVAQHGGDWLPIIAQAANLALLVGLIVYFGKRGIRRFLDTRAETVSREIEEARLLHEEARQKLEEYEARLASLQTEAEALLAEFRREGEAEKARLIEEARAEAERVTREAERAAANEVARARARLEAEVADRAIAVAEQVLRQGLTPDDARRLTNDYLGQLEQRAGA